MLRARLAGLNEVLQFFGAVVVGLVVIAVTLFACANGHWVETASAQGAIPVNGSFDSDLSGWGNPSNGWFQNQGAGTASSANDWGGLISLPFVASGSSSLSFDCKGTSSNATASLYIIDYTNPNGSWVNRSDYSLSTSWGTCTKDLSYWSGHIVSLYFYDRGTSITIDNVSVSNVTASTGENYRGDFESQNPYYWVFEGASIAYSQSVSYYAYGGYVNSYPFDVYSSRVDWGFDYNCQNSSAYYGLDVWDYTTGSKSTLITYGAQTCAVGSSVLGYHRSFSLSSFVGHKVALYFHQGSEGVDNICPDAGCSAVYPTATPSPTATYTVTSTSLPSSTPLPTATSSGGGGGGSYPTQIPYPTQVPNATPIYGAGTPVPVAIGTICPVGSPCYVTWLTPLPVTINGVGNGTPLPVKIDDSTPVIVQEATKIPPTAINPSSNASVSVGSQELVFDTSSISSNGPVPIQITGGTSDVSRVGGLVIHKQPIHFCLPSVLQNAFSVSDPCTDFDMLSVDGFYMLNVDLLPYFTFLSSVLFIVFVVRQLQER